MSLAIVHSRAQVGVEAPAVTVEAHLTNGLPALTLVGLPEGALSKQITNFLRYDSAPYPSSMDC
ncbi:hypothetical protein SAMN05444506_10881 [Pseudomonas syringae]|uniref:Mg chelatase-like protein n=1 Tax=Pseudomonas syringae pv. apii TaxID=81036 RepID=A0A3M3RRM4_9PSED|nr:MULTISPECIES: hypothetical protein [Pseudomonas syringae group]RMN99060.1 Mg chelatase-like protein [Pseudomonas syringae pv. apii]SDZ00307.1 hypothetical protein SAMN05444506_10881 [Pseudomonas syringae]